MIPSFAHNPGSEDRVASAMFAVISDGQSGRLVEGMKESFFTVATQHPLQVLNHNVDVFVICNLLGNAKDARCDTFPLIPLEIS